MVVVSLLLRIWWETVTSGAEKMLTHSEEKIQGKIGTSQLVRRGFLGRQSIRHHLIQE